MADIGADEAGEPQAISVGEVEVEEPACEAETDATLAGDSPTEEDGELTREEEEELDAMLSEAEAAGAAAAAPGLGPRGGGQGGAQKPIDRAIAIARRNGLTITSRKRSSGSSGSDHHVSQGHSDAADMSNGSHPTPQMDQTCREIATLLGHPEFRAGNLRVTTNGYRVQMLYRTNIGGNHFNHVHVGVRVG